MKVLIVTPRFPNPPIGGDRIRIHQIAEQLVARGIEIAFLIQEKPRGDLSIPASIRVSWQESVTTTRGRRILSLGFGLFNGKPIQVAYYSDRTMTDRVAKAVKEWQPDLILCHLIRMFQHCEGHGVPVLCEFTDALSHSYSRIERARNLRELLLKYMEKDRILKYEMYVLERAAAAVLVTERDRRYFGAHENLHVIHFGVRIPPDRRGTPNRTTLPPNARSILFVANMRSDSNRKAARWLVDRVWPFVRRLDRGIILEIVGPGPQRFLRSLSGEGVRVRGRVAELESFYACASLAVCPVQFGTGVQTKILEALGEGVRVVTTPNGAGGLSPALEHMVGVESSPSAFARSIHRLARESAMTQAEQERIRDVLAREYGLDTVGKRFYDLCCRLTNPSPSSAYL